MLQPTETPSPRLQSIVLEIGEALLTTTETVECLAHRMDELANQMTQQGYQVFALTEEVQTLMSAHQQTLDRLGALTTVLEGLIPAKRSS